MKTMIMKERPVQQTRPFFGRYPTSLDSEGRVRLCSEVLRQFKAWDAEEVWVAAMPDEPALVMCPPEHWDKWVGEQRLRFGQLTEVDVQRLLLSDARPAKWDKKGRISVSVGHRKHSDLRPEGRALLIGMGGYFEIWEPARFNQAQGAFMERLSANGKEPVFSEERHANGGL